MLNAEAHPLETAGQNIPSGTGKYLTFFLRDKRYAVNVLNVREIIEYDDVTPMPMMPDFVWGAINLRGAVVPVIDLARRLGDKESDICRRSCIVIVEVLIQGHAVDVGVIVDSVSKVLDLEADSIEAAPSFSGNINTDFIEGMGKLDDGFVIVLKVHEVLSLDDARELAAVAGTVTT